MVNFSRVISLLKSQHLVRAPILVKNLGIGFALILAAFILRYMGSEPNRYDGFIIAPMLVAALVFAELYMFKPLKESRATVFYLSIPASVTEKWLANLISSFILLPLLILIGCFFANLMAFVLVNVVNGDTLLRYPKWGDALKIYWFFHPLLFFGAIYFRTGVLFKTFGSIAVLFILSIVLFFLATLLAAPELMMLRENPVIPDGHNPIPLLVIALFDGDYFPSFLTLIYFSYFWGLSLLRLREVEI